MLLVVMFLILLLKVANLTVFRDTGFACLVPYGSSASLAPPSMVIVGSASVDQKQYSGMSLFSFVRNFGNVHVIKQAGYALIVLSCNSPSVPLNIFWMKDDKLNSMCPPARSESLKHPICQIVRLSLRKTNVYCYF